LGAKIVHRILEMYFGPFEDMHEKLK